MSAHVRVTLPDGSVREVPAGTTPRAVAEAIGAGLARAALAARVDGAVWDLDRPLEGDALAILTERDPEALDVLRHSAAHVLATAVRELLPERRDRLRPADRGRLLLRLRGATARSRPRTSRGSRPRWREVARRETTRSCARWWTGPRPTAGSPTTRSSSSASRELGDDETITVYTDGPFLDLCRGPARPRHRPAQALQAAPRRRRLLAGRREAADAAAHLRHRVVQEGGARRLPPPARGGAEARPPAARQGARPVHVPPVRPGRAVLDRPRHHARTTCSTTTCRERATGERLPGDQDAAAVQQGAVGDLAATGASTGRTCSWCSTTRPASTTSRSSR